VGQSASGLLGLSEPSAGGVGCPGWQFNEGSSIVMKQLLGKVLREESGQDLAEYGIALAVIAAGAALIAVLVAQNVQTLWSNAQTAVSSAVSAEH
jgi:Flp pilus assembly pilin Flp